MIEVHPPEHAPHSVRDFFLHIFTITIGLLIALGLESFVEWRHHVHVGHEAAINLRREVSENRKEVEDMLKSTSEEQKEVMDLLVFLQAHAQGKPAHITSAQAGMTLANLRDASWQTASATGALSYMPYAEVQEYASVYTLQYEYEQLQASALQPLIEFEASFATGDPNQLDGADAAAAATKARTVLANMRALKQVATGLDNAYQEVAKK